MKKTILLSFVIGLLLVNSSYAPPIGPSGVRKTKGAATFVVAASDSAADIKRMADYVCIGTDDQDTINQAISDLPSIGGKIFLLAGTYDIRRVGTSKFGIHIARSNVVLEGESWSTKLVLADSQADATYHCNVIKIDGNLTHNVIIRNLYIDGNRANNSAPVSLYHTCGVRADSEGAWDDQVYDITVEGCFIENCVNLCVAMYQNLDTANVGGRATVRNNRFGSANSDTVEIFHGPGLIEGNVAYIEGACSYVFGDDNGQKISVIDNTVSLAAQTSVVTIFRSWGSGSSGHKIIANNIVFSRSDVTALTSAIEARGSHNLIIGNRFEGGTDDNPLDIEIQGGGIIANNLIVGGDIIINNTANTDPVIVTGNWLSGGTSQITLTAGMAEIYDNKTTTHDEEVKSRLYQNTSGGSLVAGDVVIASATAATYDGSQCTTTTTAGDDLVLGMVRETIEDDAFGRILVLGKTTALKVDGTADIAIGDFLCAFTTVKIAQKATAGDMAFAIALEAYATDDSSGVVDAILIIPRKL